MRFVGVQELVDCCARSDIVLTLLVHGEEGDLLGLGVGHRGVGRRHVQVGDVRHGGAVSAGVSI